MRIVFVAGFLPPAIEKLQARYKDCIEERSCFLVPTVERGKIDLRRFKTDLFDQVAQGATDVLICAFVQRNEDHVLHSIEGIVKNAEQRNPELSVRTEFFKNARDFSGVSQRVEAFGPTRVKQFSGDLSFVEKWLTTTLANRLVLHSRALRAVKRSAYADIPGIYSALDLLGREYRDSRIAPRDQAAKKLILLQTRLNEQGLELTQSISPTRAGEEGDDYFVTSPETSTTKAFLSLHLKKGVSHDERLCLRIYFLWCESTRRVVVGWLTSHLGTRKS